MPEALAGAEYYRTTAGSDSYSPLNGVRECAVCIIGGGFAGLGTAVSLMERGQRDVVLLESEQVGFGASGRNGGFVFGGYSLGERSLVRTAGTLDGRALYRLTLDAVEQIRRRVQRYRIECELREEGIYLANWFADERILERRRRFMREALGVEWQPVGRAALAERLGTSRYSGALFEPGAFHFHPLKYAQGLARALTADGAAVHERSRVTSIAADGKGWRVDSAHGAVKARAVVICCGGYLERLVPRLRAAMLPIATYVMVTEALGARLQSVMRSGAAVYDTRFAFDYYRPLANSRLLWGGRIAVRERSAGQVADLLYRDMLKVFPQLAGTRVEYAWSGRMSYGRHQMPQLGRLPSGLWYGMGFGGHGVATTSLAGEVLADAVLGDGGPLDRFAQWGLAPAGGAAGLCAAQLAYWTWQVRDALRR